MNSVVFSTLVFYQRLRQWKGKKGYKGLPTNQSETLKILRAGYTALENGHKCDFKTTTDSESDGTHSLLLHSLSSNGKTRSLEQKMQCLDECTMSLV